MTQTAISHSDATAYVISFFDAANEFVQILHTTANEEPEAVDVIFSLGGGTYNMTVWHEPGIGLYGEW